MSATPSLSSQLEKLASNKLVLAALAAAAAGGAGGWLTSRAPQRASETDVQRRRRIIRNALLLGGAAGVGVGSLGFGLDQLNTAVPAGMERSPASKSLGNLLSGAGAATGGVFAHRAAKREMGRSADSILGALSRTAITDQKPGIVDLITKRTTSGDSGTAILKHLLEGRGGESSVASVARPMLLQQLGKGKPAISALLDAGVNPALLESATPGLGKTLLGASKVFGRGLKRIPGINMAGLAAGAIAPQIVTPMLVD